MELRTSFKYYIVPKLSQRWCNMVALKRALWAVTGFGIISASNEVECYLIHSYFSLVQCVFKEFLCLICKALTTWKFCRFPKEDERYQEGKRYIYIDLTFSICLTWCYQDALLQVSVNGIKVPHIAWLTTKWIGRGVKWHSTAMGMCEGHLTFLTSRISWHYLLYNFSIKTLSRAAVIPHNCIKFKHFD